MRQARAGIHLPHLFNIVKSANFGTEYVDDDITRIENNPISGCFSLTTQILDPQ